MPRVGRFLFGEWLKVSSSDVRVDGAGVQHWTGSYVDYRGRFHRRTVALSDEELLIHDEIRGPFLTAQLRYNLWGNGWERLERGCSSGTVTVELFGAVDPNSLRLFSDCYADSYLELGASTALTACVVGKECQEDNSCVIHSRVSVA
jgi:hypothetical protein